jgi:acyl-CoA reductase-like NAD-dependent aldehyde dehydrogenase
MSKTATVAGTAVPTGHYINGHHVDGPEHFAVHSPIDGRLLAQMSAGLDAHVDAAVAAADAAFPAWAALGVEGRLPILQRFAAGIKTRGDELARVECEDAGVLLSRMQHGVVPRSALNISFFAEFARHLVGKSIETATATHRLRYDPAGVCAIITPWNGPLMLATWRLGPALAAGNTVVLKPPEWAPLTCALLGEIAHTAGVPPGVFNVLHGLGQPTGARLVSDARVRRIAFTGSVPTARSIARAAAENMVPCGFELGGKSAFIVLEDADLDVAAGTAALMYRNAGQVCLAGTRLLVQESIAADFQQRMHSYVQRLKVGDPREADTEIGPLIHLRQHERVSGFVQRALAGGATAAWGGKPHAAGAQYYAPTLLTGLRSTDEVVQNEVFGPVLVWQTFQNDADAVAMANDTHYGLAGCVFGEQGHATAIADQVRTGMIWVNSFFLRDLNAPFGGVKNSGIGREGGEWSFEFYCDLKDVMLPKQPYKASFSKS